MSKVYWTLYLVTVHTSYALVYQFTSKSKNWAQQATLQEWRGAWFYILIRRDATATVHRAPSISPLLGSRRFCSLVLVVAARYPAMRVVIIKAAICIIPLNQTARRCKVFSR